MKNLIRDKAIRVLIACDDTVTEELLKQPNTARLLDVNFVEAVSEHLCAVCGTPLLGEQVRFCSTHWDYLLVDWDACTVGNSESWLGFPTPGFILEEHARGLEITTDLCANNEICEVCEHSAIATESIVNRNGVVLKKHDVCTDHLFVLAPVEPVAAEADAEKVNP